jgi:hypothetical protein
LLGQEALHLSDRRLLNALRRIIASQSAVNRKGEWIVARVRAKTQKLILNISGPLSGQSWRGSAIVKAVENKLAPLGHRVFAIVNYDNFTILPELLDEYSTAVRGLVEKFYSGVSRYTTSGFLRMKLGEALEKRGVAPHIFQSAAEAQSDFHKLEKGASK